MFLMGGKAWSTLEVRLTSSGAMKLTTAMILLCALSAPTLSSPSPEGNAKTAQSSRGNHLPRPRVPNNSACDCRTSGNKLFMAFPNAGNTTAKMGGRVFEGCREAVLGSDEVTLDLNGGLEDKEERRGAYSSGLGNVEEKIAVATSAAAGGIRIEGPNLDRRAAKAEAFQGEDVLGSDGLTTELDGGLEDKEGQLGGCSFCLGYVKEKSTTPSSSVPPFSKKVYGFDHCVDEAELAKGEVGFNWSVSRQLWVHSSWLNILDSDWNISGAQQITNSGFNSSSLDGAGRYHCVEAKLRKKSNVGAKSWLRVLLSLTLVSSTLAKSGRRGLRKPGVEGDHTRMLSNSVSIPSNIPTLSLSLLISFLPPVIFCPPALSSCCPAYLAGCQVVNLPDGAAALPLSQQSYDDGELILNYYTGATNPSLVSFEGNEMNGEPMPGGRFLAWGFTGQAWKDAGLEGLNDRDWEMRFDFSFSSASNTGWDSYFYIMFNTAIAQVGQRCSVCMMLAHGANTQGNLNFVLPTSCSGQNSCGDTSVIQHYDTPFSWYISRDSSTGYITIKLYRRDLQEYVVEVESRQNWQFDDAMDNNMVPVGIYLNSMVADWQGVYLWAGGSAPSTSPTQSPTSSPTEGPSSPPVVNLPDGAAALPLSQQSYDDGELILNYYTGATNPSLVSFEGNEMNGEPMPGGRFLAWGFTGQAWKDAGLEGLNDRDWEMRFDFSFSSASNTGWDSYFYIMFNTAIAQVGQRCSVCMMLAHGANTQGNLNFVLPTSCSGQNSCGDTSVIQHYDTPFSWYISRDSSTGYITIKLYRRDLQEYVVEVESRQNWQFDDAMDNNMVPVGIYLNSMVADWQGVYLWAGGSAAAQSSHSPSSSPTYTPRLAKYVKIQLESSGSLSVNEVQVVNESSTNIDVLFAVAVTMSSTDGGNVPANAVDGDTNTAARTLDESMPWLQIELAQETDISKVIIDSDGELSSARISLLDEEGNIVFAAEGSVLAAATNGSGALEINGPDFLNAVTTSPSSSPTM
ncbi:hypothetical protein THAOC_01017, partial [Thalassiosira oceanica]